MIILKGTCPAKAKVPAGLNKGFSHGPVSAETMKNPSHALPFRQKEPCHILMGLPVMDDDGQLKFTGHGKLADKESLLPLMG